jgi:hypothetical protein
VFTLYYPRMEDEYVAEGGMGISYSIIFHLQSVPVHSANRVRTYTVACGRVLSSAPLQLMVSRPLVAFGNETYKLELQTRQLH